MSMAALNYLYLGYADQALKLCGEVLPLLRRADPRIYSSGISWVVGVHLALNDWQCALERAEEYVAVTSQHEFAMGMAEATVFRSRALVGLGRTEEGLADARRAIEEAEKSGVLRLYFFNLLAECLLTAGNIAEGLAAVERGESLGLRGDSNLLRVKGELLRKQRPADEVEAEACFRLAIERARRLSTKSMELLATTSLARLLRDTNRRDDARAMLADIYNWFTEGFDTADLKDAKSLLEELGA